MMAHKGGTLELTAQVVGSLIDQSLFQAIQLSPFPSRQFSWSIISPQQSFLPIWLLEECFMQVLSFREFLSLLSCLLPDSQALKPLFRSSCVLTSLRTFCVLTSFRENCYIIVWHRFPIWGEQTFLKVSPENVTQHMRIPVRAALSNCHSSFWANNSGESCNWRIHWYESESTQVPYAL